MARWKVTVGYTKKGAGRKRFSTTVEADTIQDVFEAEDSPMDDLKIPDEDPEKVIAFSIEVRRLSL